MQGIPFRPDWEHVVTPVLDLLSARGDVDAEKLAIVGLSQGGHWVPRAVAFEKRLDGVVDRITTPMLITDPDGERHILRRQPA